MHRTPMRTIRFRPYLPGCGPRFTLQLFETGGERIRYVLSQHDGARPQTTVIFEGADFRPSPLHSIDGDAAVATLMGFLTLRIGDTDRDYFDAYTPEQIEFQDTHAEALAAECYSRFGDE